ncbi:MAG: hypothetical protein AB7C90_01770 [Bacteroidales bacterium]
MLKQPLRKFPFGHMVTASGQEINLFNPDPDKISIMDISASLSKICRFGGNINKFYSVAQHACLVAWLAPPQLSQAALMHDAAEAYCGDVIRPLKSMLGKKYGEIEEKMLRAIFSRFCIDYGQLQHVKKYDDQALEMEEQALFNNKELFQKTIAFQSSCYIKSSKSPTWNWEHQYARKAFLETFNEIPKLKLFKQAENG